MMSYRKQLVEVKKYNHDRVQIRCANQRKSLTDLNAKYKNLIEENKQLRDLLKECTEYLSDVDEYKPLKYLLNDIYGWFYNPRWELYQEPIDWDYIIKNKCLCLFWDEGKERHVRNFLKDVKNRNYKHPLFYDQNGIIWDCCCPVRRDEVTFYEDKKDE